MELIEVQGNWGLGRAHRSRVMKFGLCGLWSGWLRCLELLELELVVELPCLWWRRRRRRRRRSQLPRAALGCGHIKIESDAARRSLLLLRLGLLRLRLLLHLILLILLHLMLLHLIMLRLLLWSCCCEYHIHRDGGGMTFFADDLEELGWRVHHRRGNMQH